MFTALASMAVFIGILFLAYHFGHSLGYMLGLLANDRYGE